MSHIRDYDTAATLIADADYITKGRLLPDTHAHAAGPSASSGPSTSRARPTSGDYSDAERLKIEQGACSPFDLVLR